MSYVPISVSSDSVISDALEIASGGTSDIANVLDDIKLDSNLGANAVLLNSSSTNNIAGVLTNGNLVTSDSTLEDVQLWYGGVDSTGTVKKVGSNFYGETSTASTDGNSPWDYGVVLTNDLNISEASGAMVIDDLMQKISTKVQVAAQMLSASNNIAKTASRILSQG